MATTITKYVNTDSTPGGTGISNLTTGTDRAYASLNEAFDANTRNLVTADGGAGEIAKFICSGSVEDTTAPTLSGSWVCDSTCKIIVEAAENHGGKWNTSTYRIALNALGTIGISINNNTNIHIVEFWGIQFSGTPTSSGSSSRHFYEAVAASVVAGTIYRFIKCIIRQVQNAGYTAGTCRFFRGADADCGIRFNSCIFYGWRGQAISLTTAPSASIFNCTFVDCNSGVAGTGGGPNVRNCLFKDCTSCGTTWNATSNYNSTDLASPGPANFGANSRTSQTISFVDLANKDFHLLSSDASALGFGEDLTGSATTTLDIDSEDRAGLTWDIGADQYFAPSGGVSRTDLTIRILA